MKLVITIIVVVMIVVAIIVLLPPGDRTAPQSMLPSNAFLVSVRACDVEDAWVLPFKVTTNKSGTNVPIQEVALSHFTLSTFCQWTDWTARTIRVEAVGYEPREYKVTGKRNIIAVLYRRN